MESDLSFVTLDLGTRCGWALSGPVVAHFGDAPWLRHFSDDLAWGTLDIDRGMRAAQSRALEEFLLPIAELVDHIIREAVYNAWGRRSAAETLQPLADTVDYVGKISETEVWEVPPSTWRKHFLGRGTGKRDDMKRAAIVRCSQLGWETFDDNQADALGLMDYARACFRVSATVGPLMDGPEPGRTVER